MCIVFLTTAHPDYALIIVDNRDEFILRPTSRPEWWTHPNRGEVLSSRDLQRAEKGTWMGITKEGLFAVLTNYRETDTNDVDHPIHAIRSRGGMVTHWLGTGRAESTPDSVQNLVKDGGVKGVGGFSMLCGKLKKKGENNIEPVAIVSNRSDDVTQVPWIGGSRGEVCALSNVCYDDDEKWPKLEDGKRILGDVITRAIKDGLGEEQLIERLFGLLDTDKLARHPGMSLMDYVGELKNSIFIPAIGDESHHREMEECMARGKTGWPSGSQEAVEVEVAMTSEKLDTKTNGDVNNNLGFATGLYGTQRQTIILVDWEGNVMYRERALYDANGNPVERGRGDDTFRFKIEGWDEPQ